MTAITQTYTFSGAGEDFGPRKGDGLVVLHTFENADPFKNTMRDALAGAIWQDRNDVIGAYNRIIAVDGVLGCVPDDHISGGMAAGTSVYKPLPWLYNMLPAHMVNDGNSYSLQLCAMGRRDYYDANGWPPKIIDGFARSIIDEEQRIGREVIVANHADFQPGNRTDAGSIALPLVMARYAELMEEPTVLTRPVRELWKIPSGTSFWTGGPAMGEQKVFTADVELWSNGETTDGLWRRIEYGNEELYLRRKGMTPIPGTRNPATGYGAPSTGFTQADLDNAKTAGTQAGFGNAKAQAIVAAENHLATVRGMT